MDLALGGRQAFAYTAGHALDPARPTVIFVHGAGLDHSSWGLQSRYFGYHGFNVLAVDLPGHGRSAGPPLETIGALADWVMQLLDAAALPAASMVGHSMGSLVALECAARHPARIERLALIGTAWPMKVGPVFLDAARSNAPAAYDMDTIWAHAPGAPLGGNPNPGMWMYGDTLARLARLAPGVLYAGLKACHDYADGAASAARVKCPALLLLGARDQMAPPKAAAALAQAIPGTRTIELAGAGHSLMAEAPDAVLDALIEFLAATPAAR